MLLENRWTLLILRSHSQRSRSNYCFVKGHMVNGQCQTVGLKPKCCLLNILWSNIKKVKLFESRSNYQLQTIELYPASQKIIPYFAIKQADSHSHLNCWTTNLKLHCTYANLLNFAPGGTLMILNQFLLSLQMNCRTKDIFSTQIHTRR